MTTEEFSNGFDTYVSSYRRFKDFDKKEELDSIEFDEYEKSLYLTSAQDELVANLYNGKNIYGDSFESTEEMRRQLDVLVKQKVYNSPDGSHTTGVSSESVFYSLPADLAYIVFEQVTFGSGAGCAGGSIAAVYPVTHDEYSRVSRNPFRGPTTYKALRLDSGNREVEIVSKYPISKYMLRYISNPAPIILENLPNSLKVKGKAAAATCQLPEQLHDIILKRAVELALSTKSLNTK